jgi:hypothetical protein
VLYRRGIQRLSTDRDRNWFRVSGVVFLTTGLTEIHLIQAEVVGVARGMVDFARDPTLVELHIANVNREDGTGGMLDDHSKGMFEAVITGAAIIGDESRKSPVLELHVVGTLG